MYAPSNAPSNSSCFRFSKAGVDAPASPRLSSLHPSFRPRWSCCRCKSPLSRLRPRHGQWADTRSVFRSLLGNGLPYAWESQLWTFDNERLAGTTGTRRADEARTDLVRSHEISESLSVSISLRCSMLRRFDAPVPIPAVHQAPSCLR